MRLEAIINSMTPKERRNHEIISGSRRKRIAAGSGTTVQDVNQLAAAVRADGQDVQADGQRRAGQEDDARRDGRDGDGRQAEVWTVG